METAVSVFVALFMHMVMGYDLTTWQWWAAVVGINLLMVCI